jgi:hypothetical protein
MPTEFPFTFPSQFGNELPPDSPYGPSTAYGIPAVAPPLGELVGDGMGVKFTNWLASSFQGLKTGNNTTECPDSERHPMAALQYMRNKSDVIRASANQRPMIRLGDKNLTLVAELTGEMSCEYEELAADTGQARYVVRYENWIVDYIVNRTRVDEDLHLIIDPTPTERDWRTRWGGKIHTINVQRHEDGTSTVELIALSMREHAKKLLFAANPFFAPELQIPKMWILPGPIKTVLFMSMFVNLARLFVPGLSFITNAFNPAAWLNPLGPESLFNVDPLNWPIQVAFVNPILDTSRWGVLGATWTDWHSATMDLLKDAGAILRCYTWLDEDADSPHEEMQDVIDVLPEGISGPLTALIRPRRNCIVFRVEDWSSHEGPSGTPFDGLLNTIGVTLDDLFTSVFIDGDSGQTLDGSPLFDIDNQNPLFATLLGTAPKPPKVVWRDTQFSAIVSATHTLHKGPVKTLMTGGKSPAIVNELITFGIKYGLSQLSTMINAAIGTFVNTAFEMPGTPGLEELYQGQLSDTVMAWQRLTDPVRALWTGDLAYQEHFERGSGTAYTLAGWLTIREARYKTRAYRSFRATVRNGWPWILDRDARLGERTGWEFDQVIYVDQIMALKRGWNRKKPVLSTVSVGDDQDADDLFARGMRVLQSIYSLFGAFLGEGTLFG